MSNFNFTDRASYLAYRAEWKAEYKANSATIRKLKIEMKELARGGDIDAASSAQATRQYMRKLQERALYSLQKAKEEAQRQYLAERETKAAA
jgi:hypothetical protein